MSTDSRTRIQWVTEHLDIVAATAGLLFAVALFPLRMLTSQIFVRTIPVVIAVACVIYLLSRRTGMGGGPPAFSSRVASLLPGTVFLALAGLTVLGAVQGERTPLFYYLAIGVGALLLLQIAFVADRDLSPPVLLGQIVAFAFVIRFVALATTPGFIGIDVWTHVDLARTIRDAGSLQPISDNKYYASPLFHLVAASASTFLDLPLRAALYLTIGVALPLATLFVYASARYLVSPRWALFAAALFGIAGSVTEWGIHLIPTSLGLLFFLGLLHTVVRILHIEYTARDFLLVVFFSIAIILTHQVSSFIMLVFVAGGLVAQFATRAIYLSIGDLSDLGLRRIRRNQTVNMVGLFTFDLGLITFMWSTTPYQKSTFLGTLISYLQTALASAGFLADVSESTGGGGTGQEPKLLVTAVTYIDAGETLLLLFVTVVGSLYVLRRENVSHATLTLVIATVAMFIFTFVPTMFGIETFLPGRWWAFLAAPMALVGCVGAGYLSEHLGPSSAVLVLFLFAAAFPAVAVVSTDATIDSPAFGSTQTRYSYTASELAAVDTIGTITTPPGQDIYTDHPYQSLFERTGAASAGPAVVTNGTAGDYTLLVHRRYQTTGSAFFLTASGGAHTPSVTRDELCGDREYLYDNGDVTLCHDT